MLLKIKNKLAVLAFLMIFILSSCGGTDSLTPHEDTINNTKSSTTNANEDSTADKSSVIYNEDFLSYISVKDGYSIIEYAEFKGAYSSYCIYKIHQENRDENEYGSGFYYEIVVTRKEEVITVITINQEDIGMTPPIPQELITECDVNFDGVLDILINLGHFGNQAFVAYECYLVSSNEIAHCPSFKNIINPSIDTTVNVIKSQWRNWAASHGWGIYYFQDGEFILTERFTEDLIYGEETQDDGYWIWKDEILIDGEWETRDYYTEFDVVQETELKHYGRESYWGIDQDKWKTLFNEGMMSDFSIYGQ